MSKMKLIVIENTVVAFSAKETFLWQLKHNKNQAVMSFSIS